MINVSKMKCGFQPYTWKISVSALKVKSIALFVNDCQIWSHIYMLINRVGQA